MSKFLDILKNEYKDFLFISENDMDGEILYPRIPKNFLTKYGFEDNKTKRVCFSNEIDGCLMALSSNLKGKILYVHRAIKPDLLKTYKPSLKEVPDCELTKEIWYLDHIEIEKIHKILVLEAYDEGYKYTYGPNNEYTAELYKWKYKLID